MSEEHAERRTYTFTTKNVSGLAESIFYTKSYDGLYVKLAVLTK